MGKEHDRERNARGAGLTRRELLGRSAALGAVLSVPALVAACGGGEEESAGTQATTAPSTTTAAATTGGEAAPDFSARFAKYEPALEPNGDLSKVVWPDFVLSAPPEIKRLYEFQITNGELMRYMPCFCGCGQNAGHRSNRDCYVRRVNPDGSVVLDSMAPT